jgi:CDP-diacylglycerol--serine O-phosphatidyltransferase
LGWLAALVFAIACALRLARFNVMIDDPDRAAWRADYFVGMPAPAGAVVGLLPIYLHDSIFGRGAPHGFVWLEILYVLAVAMLMVSRLPHFSGKSVGRVPLEWLAAVLIGLAAAVLLLANFPMQTLAAMSLAYLAAIPWSYRQFQAREKAETLAQAAK